MGAVDVSLPLPVNTATIADYIRDSIAVKQKILEDQALQAAIVRVVEVCLDAFRNGNKILLGGNGGSAADAQHVAAEFVSRFEFDRPGLPAIALTVDTSALTAIGNDYGYELLFSRQLEALARPGDVFIGITTSGNSRNILKGFEACDRLGVIKVALCGAGGKVHELADHVLAAPSTHTPRIQESHLLIEHMICALIEEQLFASEYKKAKS
ncbi:D-sedoheptulose 7-phosphate isomerase [Algiphilus sp. W345]|uniref:Phosphoheptose isomerase n=1 Tax=Banduia mediterranea TaxID=3075609 RepID=A0ABU2WI80_9GAMM|nr:D-sedoheptulose 7-phosphate isomerase [Algiphilus sp. W345]MDT0496996.1 D-sedoheptulose 7-phosphate isomerase [Algiphilus sp. W345]